MIFLVQRPGQAYPQPGEGASFPVMVLGYSDWDDYGYRTTCNLYMYKYPGASLELIGSVRVMYLGQESHWSNSGSPEWVFANGPFEFSALYGQQKDYCSISSDVSYYNNLKSSLGDRANDVLIALKDAAFSDEIWNKFSEELPFKISLLRDRGSAIEVRDVVKRIYHMDSETVDTFSYSVQLPGAPNVHKIDFDFSKVGGLPNQLNIIAGVNGCGKTQLMSRLAIELSGITSEYGEDNYAAMQKRIKSGNVQPIPSLYSVIAISFNPFDQFERPKTSNENKIRYTYCGIRKDDDSIYSEEELIDILRSLASSMSADQKEIMRSAAQNVLGMEDFARFFGGVGKTLYKMLSAGQKITLNILAHLIINLKDRTLVLLDEPETHLHPSLMAALMTEIISLLKKFNSFAIVATHSPIIAQQVPTRYINVVSRGEDMRVTIDRPSIECFGENLSDITNVLFETREYERDYTKIIDDLFESNGRRADIVESLFPEGMGRNAKIYLWSLANSQKH